MTQQDELERAALWRQQQRRRVLYQGQVYRSLAGDPATAVMFRLRWAPLVAFLAERHEPPLPPEAEIDPYGISDQVNVGL